MIALRITCHAWHSVFATRYHRYAMTSHLRDFALTDTDTDSDVCVDTDTDSSVTVIYVPTFSRKLEFVEDLGSIEGDFSNLSFAEREYSEDTDTEME